MNIAIEKARVEDTEAVLEYLKQIGQFKDYVKINGEYVDCDFMNLYIK